MKAHDTDLTGTLTRWSLERRITVLMLFLTILVVGVIAMLGIPLELVPQGYESQSLQVFVPFPNSPARETLEKITLPLEEELSTVRQLQQINSWSGSGGANAFLLFKPGADMDVAYREVRDRVERARLLFPEEVDRVFIHKEDVSGIPVAAIGLAIDPALTDRYSLIQREVIKPLSRIDGVARVNINGLEEKEIIIEVDKQRAEAHGLNIYQLAQELSGDNFTMASGNIRESGDTYLLRSVATFTSLEDIERRPLNDRVRLKDVARIVYEEAEKDFSVRVNGRPAVAAIVLKEGEANTVALSRRLREAVEEMKQNPRLANIQLEMIFNQGSVVEDSAASLVNGGKLGGFFAALVLYIFLRRFRLTMIITLSIPLSILIALVVMFFAGETLNVLSMLGLVICVGLLVDNSVVVAENIHRLRQDGLSRRDACIKGAGEIALAVTLATLTTVIVFLPAALIEGEAKFFLMRLAIPISVALLASLLVALVFVPLSVYLTLPAREGEEVPRTLRARMQHRVDKVMKRFYALTFGALNHGYNISLAFFLRHRLDLVLGMGAVFYLTFAVAWKEVELVPTQEEDQTGFRVGARMSDEYSFEDVSAWFSEAEKVLETNKEAFGLRGYLVVHHRRGGHLEGWFDREKRQDRPAKEITEAFVKALPKRPGLRLYYGQENRNREAKGKEVFTVRLEGEDPELLDDVAGQIEPILLRVKGVLGVREGNDAGPTEMAMVIDRERATSSEVNPGTIAGVIGYALRGQSLPKYNQDGREIPVRIRFEEEDRATLQALNDFMVPTADGGVLPISALTETRMMSAPRGIFRSNKRVSRMITLDLKTDEAAEARRRLEALEGNLDLPEGISFGSTQFSDPMAEFAQFQIAIPLAVLFIYMLMGFLFESFILPLSIVLTIPLSTIGVVWIHYVTGKDLDVLGCVGAILLVGVVVNNGIVLIDYVNRLRSQGMERTQALLTATHRRFRPIVMTALTTIIGMIPLAMSEPNEIGLSYKSFGLTLIGGMTTASILTLLVVPVFYTFFDDIRTTVARLPWGGSGRMRS